MMSKTLIKYLQHGTLNKWEAFLVMFFPSLIELKNANKIYSIISGENKSGEQKPTIKIPVYTADHIITRQIQQYLLVQNHPAICAALVHGSIASNEVTSYSDFDGILIIDPSEIANNIELFRLREIIQESSMLMYKMDALQHHHWTIILKDDLLNYRDDLLPAVLIQNAKVIYPSKSVHIELRIAGEKLKYSDGFYRLKRSIEDKLLLKNYERDFYSFKNLLSEILLLPAMFMQSVNKKGVLKKESFELASAIIPVAIWKVMNEVSDLRLNWNQEEPKFLSEIKALKYRHIPALKKHFRTSLPSRYQNWFSEKRIKDLSALINFMQSYLEKK